MQERGQTPYPEPAPEGAGASLGGASKPKRGNRLLGCGCLAVLAVAVVVIVAVTTSSKPGSPSAGSGPAAPAAASSCSASALAAGGSAQAGFGTTVQSWDCIRNPDGDFNPGSSYGADPTLPQINGHTGARYVAVQRQLGYVTAYQINFHPHTAITAALADILAHEFPADASYLWKKAVTGQCYQAEVKSASLAASLNGTGVDDPAGLAFVEAKTLPPGGLEGFDPGDVTYASLSLQSYTSAGQAGGC